MRTLGNSFISDDGVIVEMSRDEYHSLINLERVITGTGYSFDRYGTTFKGVDLSPVFKALYELSVTKSSIIQLQEYINKLADYFGKVEIPKEKDA